MKRIETVLSPVVGLLCLACAGTLDDPSLFEEQTGTADGIEQRDDAGTPSGDGDQEPAGDGDSNTPPAGDGDTGGEGDAGLTPPPATAECDFQGLIQEKCGVCHGAVGASAGLDLTSEGVADRLVDVGAKACDGSLVDPADPRQSVLYIKVSGSECGSVMPPSGTALSADEQACILSWIEQL